MMRKEFIKQKMEEMNISINKLKNITGIGYATLNNFFNKESYNISANHYVNIIDTLFTPYEQLLYQNALNKSMFNKGDVPYWYNEFIKRKIESAVENETIEISLSGAPTSDDEGIMRMVPAHIVVTFKDVEGKSQINIFDDVLYRSIGKNGGKRNKRILLFMYLGLPLSQQDKEFKEKTFLHFSK